MRKEVAEKDFFEAYHKVFDKSGNVRNCGRSACAELIQLARKYGNPKPGHYGDCDSNSPRYGIMQVTRIKALYQSLV